MKRYSIKKNKLVTFIFLSILLISMISLWGCAIPEPEGSESSLLILQVFIIYKTDIIFFTKEKILPPTKVTILPANNDEEVIKSLQLSHQNGIHAFFNLPSGEYFIDSIEFSPQEDAPSISVQFEGGDKRESLTVIPKGEASYMGTYIITYKSHKLRDIKKEDNEKKVLRIVLDTLRGTKWENILRKKLGHLGT